MKSATRAGVCLRVAKSTHFTWGSAALTEEFRHYFYEPRGYVIFFSEGSGCGGSAVAVHRQAGGHPVLARVVVVPVTVQRQFLGSDRGVPAPQIMGIVEVIPLVFVIVGVIVVCQCHRSWRFSSCGQQEQ